MKKLIAIFLTFNLFFFVQTCSKIESVYDTTKETIALEEGLDVNYDDLTVVTIDGSGAVDEEGRFDINTISTIKEELPILFTKDNEVMFGYYSKTGSDNTVSIDDILLFYFSMHPEIVLRGLSGKDLMNLIRANENYESLKMQIESLINSNLSPFKNESFTRMLNNSGYAMGISKRTFKTTKKKGEDIFQYTYTRDGTVSWPSEFPVFCTVGLEIINADTQTSVSGPQILDKSKLYISPGAWVEALYDYLTKEDSDYVRQFKFPSDGQYDIKFTNGVDRFGTAELESRVDAINRFNLGVDILSFVIPIGIDKVFGEADCRNALISYFKDMSLSPIKYVMTQAGPLDSIEADKELAKIAKDIFDVIVDCGLQGKEKGTFRNYLDKIRVVTKYFNWAQDGATLTLFLRDYLASNIKGWETRYYYDGVSYGNLEFINLTGVEYINISGDTEFKGAVNSEHDYKAQIKEEVYQYLVESDFVLTSSLTTENKKELAIGIPFRIDRIYGVDGDVKNATSQIDGSFSVISDIIGIVSPTFVIGEQDSEFEIKPDFQGKGLPASETITLKVSGSGIDMSGEWIPTWEMAECNKLGSYCCGCDFHKNERNFVFKESNSGCSSLDQCGELDFETQRIGSGDTVTLNQWSISGDTLTIKLESRDGYQFSFRDLNYSGVYDPNSDSFVGLYTSDFTGGTIISAKANGTLTLTRVK